MEDQGATGLPASIEAAWGVRTRPSKGPRPALSLERIVAPAVRVAAGDGLQAVSMGRVASDLGVSTMSLYRYVGAKDELLALMADLTFEAPPAPRGPQESWREGLSRWAWTELAVYRRNPWVLRIPMLQADIAAAAESELMASYGRLLARLTDPERFPALHAVIAAGVFDEPDDGDLDFSFGLERVLDGIETLIDKRRIGRG
jgi:AcrR family transcriptional regulator